MRAVVIDHESGQPASDLVELSARANALYEQAESAKADTVRLAAECGKALIAARGSVPRGQWGEWLAENFRGSSQIAYVYIKLAKFQRVGILDGPDRPESIRQALGIISKRNKLDVHHSSESPEHYTPSVIIELVMQTLGDIDLDPCSDPGGNVPARHHFTKEDDGLAREWHGKVYVNPPYGKAISAWVDKALEEFRSRRTSGALLLLPARTDTQWWAKLGAYPVCFITGRLKFIGNDDPAPFPSAVVYLAQRRAWNRFAKLWRELGLIYNPEG